MYMDKWTSVLEIKSNSAHLLIGYLLNDKIKVVYRKRKKLTTPLSSGDVLDAGQLSNDLHELVNIDDKELNFKYHAKDIILVLPPFGLEVYHSTKTTNCIDDGSKGISTIDVKNVKSLFTNEIVPGGSKIVNIIPNYYQTDDGLQSLKAPYEKVSRRLTLDANVFSLPYKMIDDITRATLNADFNIKDTLINSLCIVRYLKALKFEHQNYILVDIGSNNTIISIVVKNKLVSSTHNILGGDNLTKDIQNEFNIDFDNAEILKKTFGFDSSNNTFNVTISKGLKEGNYTKYNKNDLNKIVNSYLNDYSEHLHNSINFLLKDFQDRINTLPIVFKGNTSKLNGFKESMIRNFPSNDLYFIKGDTVGASFDEYGSLLGAVYLNKDLNDNNINRNSTNINSSLKRMEGDYNE